VADLIGSDYEPISINFFGGFAINNVDENGTVSVGEALCQLSNKK
jgi:hypothetical protein